MFPPHSEMCSLVFPSDAVTLDNVGFTTLKFPICGFKFADEFDCMWQGLGFTSMSEKPHILSLSHLSISILGLAVRRNQN